MRSIRTCKGAALNTGHSACQIDFDKVIGAIAVEHGVKLPEKLTPEEFEELCHADRPNRIYPIVSFVEYAKNGGEPQTNAEGYGGTGVSGVNARTDTFTMDKFREHLNASLLKAMNTPFDVYYYDRKGILYGYNDGTDILAGVPMSTIYPTAVPHPTSSAKSSLTVSFCYEDAQDAMENFDYMDLGFNPKNYLKGLVGVVFVADKDNKYKIVEKIGGYDRTPEFGQLIADGAAEVMDNVTSATYSDGSITIVPKDGAIPALKSPSVLFTKGIKGIEQVV